MTPDKAFWLFVVFASLVFLMGGGSRYDITSLGPLRAITAGFLAFAIISQTAESFRRVRLPVIFIGLLALLMVVQLIPLPVAWWSALPGRGEIYQAGQLVGLGDIRRPITFSPQRTWNSLASLIVPLTAVLLLSLLDDKGWGKVRKVLVGAGVVSALLGIAQLMMPGSPGLFLYNITHDGSAVGLFANRNHNALLLNIALLCSLHRTPISARGWKSSDLYVVAADLLILVGILVNGSRFGFALLAGVALVFAVRMVFASRGSTSKSKSTQKRKMLAGGTAAIFAVGLVGVFAAMNRIEAVRRLFEQDVSQDLRARSLPYVLDMVTAYFPFGVGLGAFEQAYRTLEAEELLAPSYFNHAHNDWLQIVIEGGLAGALLVLAAIMALLYQGVKYLRSSAEARAANTLPVLGFLILACIAAHSIVDYPLRVPSIMLTAMVAVQMILRTPDRPARAS